MRNNHLYMGPWSAHRKEGNKKENLFIYVCQAIPGLRKVLF